MQGHIRYCLCDRCRYSARAPKTTTTEEPKTTTTEKPQVVNEFCTTGKKHKNKPVCCASECLKCGGGSCNDDPAGGDKCCSDQIAKSLTMCLTSTDEVCNIPSTPAL